MGEGIAEHFQTIAELLDGPHDHGVLVEVLDPYLQLLVYLIGDVVFEVETSHSCALSGGRLLLIFNQTHSKLLGEVLLSVKGREFCLTRHLNVALLELDVLAHHDADQIGLLDFLGYRGQLEENLLGLLFY